MKTKETENETWEEFVERWEMRSKVAAKTYPLKNTKKNPKIPHITQETKKNLRWKAFSYILLHDQDWSIISSIAKRPFFYTYRLLRSFFKKMPMRQEDDLFFYGFENEEAFKRALSDKDCSLVLGFSYCQKPLECPSGRFTDQCINSSDNPVCQQCPISKMISFQKRKNTKIIWIPTVHYIGKQMFSLIEEEKKFIFMITACEMTLKMFADWGNMLGIKGIGLRLQGRICNTMQAFVLSEKGIKPGLTIISEETEKRVFKILEESAMSIKQ